MKNNFKEEVQLYFVFDILNDVVRRGPILWKVDRERLADVKNHSFDLLLIFKILEKYFPKSLDAKKIENYMMFHDLPEAITWDITKFEGVSEEEIKRVTQIAIDWLDETFKSITNVKEILEGYENRVDIEAKISHMIDKVHSAIEFIKYQSEQDIDMDNPEIPHSLRNHPFVVKKTNEGKDVADIFYEFHMKAVDITEDECVKYGITSQEANEIVSAIRDFMAEMYNQKVNKTIFNIKNEFPNDAMIYNPEFME